MTEYEITKMIGVEVKHIKFGKGIILKVEGNYMSIDFGDVGMKTFQYPDAFEKFLEVTNYK